LKDKFLLANSIVWLCDFSPKNLIKVTYIIDCRCEGGLNSIFVLELIDQPKTYVCDQSLLEYHGKQTGGKIESEYGQDEENILEFKRFSVHRLE